MGQFISVVISFLAECVGRLGGRKRVKLPDDESADVFPPIAEPEPIYIAVMGPTGSGKTTENSQFVNLASDSSFGVGLGLESATTQVQLSAPFHVGDKRVVLVDTPGFGDTTLTDSDIWKTIAAYLVTSHHQGIHLTGVIYMQRITDVKVGGSARQSFKMFQDLCGDEAEADAHILLVTNMWDSVAPDVGHAREQELAGKAIFFKPLLDRGAGMMRHDNSRDSALRIVQSFLDGSKTRKPVVLRIQKELGGGVDIMQTSVYRQLDGMMSELVSQLEKKLETLMGEMAEAEQNEDDEARGELQEEVQSAAAELHDAREKASRLASEYQAELHRIDGILRRQSSGSRVR